MTTQSAQFEDMKEPIKLSERDEQLVGLIAVGLTDAEIATRLQIPEPEVASHITVLLAKLGVRDRVEIVLYAYSDPAMYHRITTEILNKTTKTPQGQTPQEKQKAG